MRWALALALGACRTAELPPSDRDGDGVLDGLDCAPDDPAYSSGSTWYRDADGDGYGDPADGVGSCGPPAGYIADNSDCDDGASAVHPGAEEVWYDGSDEDCAGDSDFDQDHDGYDRDVECDDTDPTRFPDPSVTEIWYDGEDDNCDGNDGDQDGDGWYIAGYPYEVPPAYAVGDCWDDPAAAPWGALNGYADPSAADVNPGVADPPYDGLDEDCAGDDDFDADADGFRTDAWPDEAGAYGADCDDAAAGTWPGADDAWYDGVDADCAGNDDYDADYDGYDTLLDGDCQDDDPGAHPGAVEDCATADDEDCDGSPNGVTMAGATTWYADADGDGFGAGAGLLACVASDPYTAAQGGDCDDSAPTVYPGAVELCDGVRQNCDGTAWSPAAEAGTAAVADASGEWSDVTALLAVGTAGSPADYALPADGTLYVCSGTWYVRLSAPTGDSTTAVVGPAGRDATVLSAAGTGRVVTVTDATVSLGLEGLTLTQGDAIATLYGGAVYASSSDVTVTDCAFTSNRAGSTGGAISVLGGSLSISGSTFSANAAGVAGGALYAQDADVLLSDVTFEGNEASGAEGVWGGAAWLGSTLSADLTVEGSTFSHNDAYSSTLDAEGAGLYLYSAGSGAVHVSDSTFTGGSLEAPGHAYGGGLRILARGASAVSLEDVLVDANAALGAEAAYGGGLSIYSDSTADLSITGGAIRGNVTVSPGGSFGAGLIYGGVGAGGLQMDGVEVSGNGTYDDAGQPANVGGGLYLQPVDNDVRLTGVTITGNVSGFADGLCVDATGGSETLLDGGTDIYANASSGVLFEAEDAGPRLTLSGAQVRGHPTWGYYVYTPSAGGEARTQCTGASDDRTGFWGNGIGYASDCAPQGGSCRLDASSCDFGSGADDNTTYDVVVEGVGARGYGDDVSMTCEGTSCS